MRVSLTEREWSFINEIILNIHSAEDNVKMRQTFFDLLHMMIHFDHASFYLYENDRSTKPVGVGLTREELESYCREEDMDPFKPLRKLFSDPTHTVVRVRDYTLKNDMEDDEYYQRLWEPKGIRYSLFAGIGYDGQALGSLSLYRTASGEDFSDKDIEIMNVLKAHLNIFLWKDKQSRNRCPDTGGASLYSVKKRYSLTDREIEVIELWSRGSTDDEICEILSISRNTLKKHISNIFGKLEINSRVELLKVLPQGTYGK